MRKKLFPTIAVFVLIAAGYYAWWASHTGPALAAVVPQKAPEQATAPGAFVPRPIKKMPANPYTGPAFVPEKKYPPGTYIPAGFAADYRERVVREFSHFVSTRLNRELDAEQARKVAAAQNAFWDKHGPNVDLFAEGKISQPEFSERTHQASIAMDTALEAIFTDDEYQKVFDTPKGTDTFYMLAHSPTEQPGMKFQADNPGPPNLSVLPEPHPTGASVTEGPAPPTSTDKFPKGGIPSGPAPAAK